MIVDVIVVGTGPSGVHATATCAARGKNVHVLDVGYDDPETRGSIPAGNFATLRQTDEQQARYFVGGDLAAGDLAGVRVGAQLTPPRQFVTRNAEQLAPIDSSTFSAMQSLALGGLGAGWGAGAYSYNDRELEEAGLPVAEMPRYYDEVATEIGVAAPTDDDTSAELTRFRPLLPPHPLDSNTAVAYETYKRKRARVRALGLMVGRAPGAILSEPSDRDDERLANPYDDMDFYSDASRSVYRPRYTLASLLTKPNVSLRSRALVTHFVVRSDAIDVHYRDVDTGEAYQVSGRRLVLAAGAISTSRIALRALGVVDRAVPILSNAYAYIPCVNVPMLGRPVETRRHSLAQLSGVFAHAERPSELLLLSFFSYRSLLLFKLIKEMPLPPQLGLLAARLLLSSLTIVGVHQPDRRSAHKSMRLVQDGGEFRLKIAYAAQDDEMQRIGENLQCVRTALRAMGCVALGTIFPGNGSSIHYAGAFGVTGDRGDVLGTTASGQLHAAPGVFIADSANWRYLPSKGLTMTLMANARRVASAACDSL